MNLKTSGCLLLLLTVALAGCVHVHIYKTNNITVTDSPVNLELLNRRTK